MVEGRAMKNKMATVLRRKATAGTKSVRRLPNPKAIRGKEERMPVAAKTGELTTGRPRERRFRSRNTWDLTIEKGGMNARPPGGEEGETKKAGSRRKSNRSKRRKRGTSLGKSVSMVVARKRAMARDPLKKNGNARGREKREGRPDRKERRRQKERRTRGKTRDGRKRIREDNNRRERAISEMTHTPLQGEVNRPNLSYEARAVFSR